MFATVFKKSIKSLLRLRLHFRFDNRVYVELLNLAADFAGYREIENL
jgi:hypothetical protein